MRSGWLGAIRAGRDSLLHRSAELTNAPDAAGRDLVLIGMPLWAGGPPPAVDTYVRSADLASAAVAAFCTHGGSGCERAFARLAEMLPSGLAATLSLPKPKLESPELDAQLREWLEGLPVAKP